MIEGFLGGLEFSISGFFWVGKFWQVFSSLGSLIEVERVGENPGNEVPNMTPQPRPQGAVCV